MNIKLYTTGPVRIPPEVQREICQPMIYHRDPEFIQIYQETITGIQEVLQTRHDVLAFTASGTGGMEAMIVNLLCKDDEVLVVDQGKFSSRWTDICMRYGVRVHKIELLWRDSVKPEQIGEVLSANTGIKAVFITHCETSTGAINDLEAVSKTIHDNSTAIFIVDAISTVGAVPFRMDRWNVDAVAITSNKGLMNPPGVVFAGVNEKAWEMAKRSDLPKYYFDFFKLKDSLAAGRGSAFTPAIPLIRGVHQALSIIREIGLDRFWDLHRKLAYAFRTGMMKLGLEIWPPNPSDSLTVIAIPDALNAIRIATALKEKYDIIVSKGQAQLRDRIIRIGHFGEVIVEDYAEIISALESVLIQLNWKFDRESGINSFYEALNRRD